MIIIPGESIAALDRIGPVRPVPGSRGTRAIMQMHRHRSLARSLARSPRSFASLAVQQQQHVCRDGVGSGAALAA
jgi:hypothetical protein